MRRSSSRSTPKGCNRARSAPTTLQARVDGTLRAHRISAHIETPARPPAWSENLVGTTGTGTRATLDARGAWRAAPTAVAAGRPTTRRCGSSAREGKGDPWLDVKGLQGELVFDARAR